jgi:hypothetical protein
LKVMQECSGVISAGLPKNIPMLPLLAWLPVMLQVASGAWVCVLACRAFERPTLSASAEASQGGASV